jgi:hypothetical protein
MAALAAKTPLPLPVVTRSFNIAYAFVPVAPFFAIYYTSAHILRVGERSYALMDRWLPFNDPDGHTPGIEHLVDVIVAYEVTKVRHTPHH